jgi:polyphosphate kinase
VWASDVVLANIEAIFPGHAVVSTHFFRIIREGDLSVSTNETRPLPDRVIEATRAREAHPVVQLTIDAGAPAHVQARLADAFHITGDAIAREKEVQDLTRLWDLARVPRHDLHHAPFTPQIPSALAGHGCLFTAIREADHLLHHPYESFDPVVDLICAASVDPQVDSIATTIYRTDRGQSPLVSALETAAARGVRVQAVVELRARFDERRNAEWSGTLRSAGAEVCHGRHGLKVHAKMTLIRRRDADGLRSYVHLSSGNYSSFTSHVYTDVALLTTNPAIAADVDNLFAYLGDRRPDVH